MATNTSFKIPFYAFFILLIPLSFYSGYQELQIIRNTNYEFEKAATAIQYLINNLQERPISWISIVKPGEICPRGEKETLSMPVFGTESMDIKELFIEQWENNTMCVEYVEEVQYLNSSTEECQDGFKKCSSNFCVGESEECPIVGIDQHVDINATIQDDQFSFKGNVYYNVSREVGEDEQYAFYTTLAVSIFSQPCFVGEIDSESPINTLDKYKIVASGSCSEYGQDLDSIGFLQTYGPVLYKENKNIAKNKDLTPEYINSMYYERVYLSARKRVVPVMDKCVPVHPLPKLGFNFSSIKNTSQDYALGIIILMDLLSILSMCVYYCIIKENQLDKSAYFYLKGISYIIFGYSIIMISVLYFYNQYTTQSYIANFKSTMDYLDDYKIFNDFDECYIKDAGFLEAKIDLDRIYDRDSSSSSWVQNFQIVRLCLVILVLVIVQFVFLDMGGKCQKCWSIIASKFSGNRGSFQVYSGKYQEPRDELELSGRY